MPAGNGDIDHHRSSAASRSQLYSTVRPRVTTHGPSLTIRRSTPGVLRPLELRLFHHPRTLPNP